MKYNKKWFSILLAMGMMLVATLLIFTLLEYIIPFSRNVKGIENASVSYYQAGSSIEGALLYLKQNDTPWSENNQTEPVWSLANWYDISANGNRLPALWTWDSSYFTQDDDNKNWNSINQGNPIQLEFWNNMISNAWNFSLYYRIPDIDESSVTQENMSTSYTGAIINWQLNSLTNTLNSDDSYASYTDICPSKAVSDLTPCTDFPLFSKQWEDLNGNLLTFGQFYNNNCGVWNTCNLKLSAVNLPKTTDGKQIPYIEWYIELWWLDTIPLRYSRISATGKSYGFKKSLNVRVPQQTVSEAFDFTVLQ